MELLPTLQPAVSGGDKVTSALRNTVASAVDENLGEIRVETNNNPPRKRAVLITMYVLCLSFLLLVINILVDFVTSLVRDETFWRQITKYVNASRSHSLNSLSD